MYITSKNTAGDVVVKPPFSRGTEAYTNAYYFSWQRLGVFHYCV